MVATANPCKMHVKQIEFCVYCPTITHTTVSAINPMAPLALLVSLKNITMPHFPGNSAARGIYFLLSFTGINYQRKHYRQQHQYKNV